jgi:Arylsulfotransferase (ASST)
MMLPAMVGCTGGGPQPSGAEVAVSADVATVVTVRWETAEAGTAWVEFGPTEDLGRQTPESDSADTEHRSVLMGLPADSDVYLRVVTRIDGELERSAIESIRTDPLPAEVPEPASTEGTAVEDWMLIPVLGGVWGPVMLNSDNQVVWYNLPDGDMKVFRAIMSVDGSSVVYNRVESSTGESSQLVRVSLDGSRTERLIVAGMSHDFAELDDGTIGTMIYDNRMVDGVEYEGNALVEVDPDGTVREIWNSWDWFDPLVTGGDPEIATWTHANAIDYDPDDDAWILGLRNFSSIYQIDRATGDIAWGLGDDAAEIEIEGPNDSFLRQHQFDQVGADGLLVFDNEGGAGGTSRIVEYQIDHAAGTASLLWSTAFEPAVLNAALGDVWRTDGGDTVVVISMAGEILRLAADGQTTGRLNLGLGYALGYGTPLSSAYGAAGE